mmetsp:Transcript_47469/g.153759  ORF Transcript_47469/g.153759 Transcript_47469/m.153759 type:complete len:415 (+) Transcript_47469:2055-3299(+)
MQEASGARQSSPRLLLQRLVAGGEERREEDQRAGGPEDDEADGEVGDGVVLLGAALDTRVLPHVGDLLQAVVRRRDGVGLARPRTEDGGADGRDEAKDENERCRQEIEEAEGRLRVPRPLARRRGGAPAVEPQTYPRDHEQGDEGDGGEGDGEEPQSVAEALLRQEKARPVDGDHVGQVVRPARVLVRQPRRVGGGQDGADLVEAKEHLGLGREADRDVNVDGPIGKAEQAADVALLPPFRLAVGPSHEAARGAEGEDNASDDCRRRAARSALFALVAVDKVVILRSAELALRASEAGSAVLVRRARLLHPPATRGLCLAAGASLLAGLAIAAKVAALCQHGGGGAGAPEAAQEDEGRKGGVVRAGSVRRAGLAVFGGGGQDVPWVGRGVPQVVAVHADRADGAAADRAEGMRT